MLKLLIVDDDHCIRQGLSSSLPWKRIGLEVSGTAANGHEGMLLVKKINPDIIITDIKMPGVDGLQFIERIREQNFKNKIILLSGIQDFEYAKKAIRFAVSDYVLKPVDEDELISIVEKCVHEIRKERGFEIPKTLSRHTYTDNIAEDKSSILIRQALDYIEDHYREPITVSDVAQSVMLHPNYFSLLFSRVMNIHCSSYIAMRRVEQSKLLMESSCLRIYEIAEQVGFSDYRIFSKTFKKIEGKSPTEYCKGLWNPREPNL